MHSQLFSARCSTCSCELGGSFWDDAIAQKKRSSQKFILGSCFGGERVGTHIFLGDHVLTMKIHFLEVMHCKVLGPRQKVATFMFVVMKFVTVFLLNHCVGMKESLCLCYIIDLICMFMSKYFIQIF